MLNVSDERQPWKINTEEETSTFRNDGTRDNIEIQHAAEIIKYIL